MQRDYTDAQELTEKIQRATGTAAGISGNPREALLAALPLSKEQQRRASRRVAERAHDPADGRELLAKLGLLEDA